MKKDWDSINSLNDLHTCYFTPAEGCKLCTHQNLCIFDDELMAIDLQIVELEKQLPYAGTIEKVGNLQINIEQEIIKRKIRKLNQKRRGR